CRMRPEPTISVDSHLLSSLTGFDVPVASVPMPIGSSETFPIIFVYLFPSSIGGIRFHKFRLDARSDSGGRSRWSGCKPEGIGPRYGTIVNESVKVVIRRS